ncbi:Ion transport family protein [Acanthocheilonema viteae]
MLQQPVSRELRSFQSLSRFSGPRGLLNRRQSNSRRYLQSRRRTTESCVGDPQVLSALGPGPSTEYRSFLPYTKKTFSLSMEVSPLRPWHDSILEEDDYQKQTQVGWDSEADIINEECDLPYPGFTEPALHCLRQAVPPRSWALRMVMNPWFDRITMIVILINCVTLGMYRPCEDNDNCTTYRCYVLSTIDHVIFAYFALEMMIKIVALGFCGSAAYLSDTWNRLDFFIVCAGCAEYLLQEYLGNINLTAIRTIRVLRPLRAVNRIPSMRILVNLLLDTLPMLGNVLLLCFFVFFIFGIVGVQLWAGLLRNRCVISLPKINAGIDVADISLTRYYIPEDTSLEYICSQADSSGLHTCNNLPPYVHNGVKCNLTIYEWANIKNDTTACVNWNAYYSECKVMHRNPFQGSISFDNIGFAWIAIFLVISLEGWTDIMYYVQDAHSFWNWIYFVLLIIIGAFFMINLCLVVIATQFAETKRRETERMIEERKRLRSSGSLSSDQAHSSRDDEAGDSIYATIVKSIRHYSRRLKRRFLKQWKIWKERFANRWKFFKNLSNNTHPKTANSEETKMKDIQVANADTDDKLLPLESTHCEESKLQGSIKNLKWNGSMNVTDCTTNSLESDIEMGSTNDNQLISLKKSLRVGDLSSGEESDVELSDQLSGTGSELEYDNVGGVGSNDDYGHSFHFKPEDLTKTNSTLFGRFREKLRAFVVCNHFKRGILFAILINTLSMGVEYHQQPELLTTILEISNYFFTGLFALEMLLKIGADGLFGYLSDGFNLFDGGIVALSVLELFQEGKGGLSVLRTFRLLRILKLVRFMPALRYQLLVMLRTMDNVTVFFGLLVLFIFIFSILGMNLFGCKFCKNPATAMDQTKKCERKNFDSLLWALVTVFQILTQEDWNVVLFNGMARTTPWAALYFVALMTFGNYVLFNLLVAILVEGFQESKEEEKRQLEEEAIKKANVEEEERKRELELFLARASSSTYLNQKNPPVYYTYNQGSGNFQAFQDVYRMRYSVPTSADNDEENEKSLELGQRSFLARRTGSFNRHHPLRTINPNLNFRLDRHTSLILPQMAPKFESYSSSEVRQRMNSWCGMQTRLNPFRSIGGQQAVIEAYTRDRLIEANEELQIAIEQEERRKRERQNTKLMQLLKKTCFYKRADYSLYIFSSKNRIRIKCLQLTEKKWFDYTILIFIGINCITLAMERPSIPPKSLERQFLTFAGYVFTVIFTIEMSMKVIANGCLLGKDAYFKDGWNILDGALVIISLTNIVFELFVHIDSPKIFGVIRVLRLLRALRPLRVINRAPGVKLVVMTLISSLKPIGNIVLICCTFFIIFGILGVQLFKGMMFHCVGPNISNVTTKTDCLMDPRNRWVNHRYNFDNLGQALMSLFVLSSKDGWVAIMYQGIDATGVDLQPIENYNEWRMIYFISFLLLVGFFVLNMFVGVVVENFHKCKEALEAEMKEQARKKRLERKLKRQQYESEYGQKKKRREKSQPYWHNYGPTRLFLNNIVTSKYFDLAIAAVIGVNVISMAMEFYMMPTGLKYVLKTLNYFFTAVFTLESAIKLVALGVRRFFSERWNQLDISIVILSIAGIVFEEFEALELPINPTIIRVMRVLRIARVLKLLKMAKGIRSLLDTVGEALPQVGNLGSLFFLLFFIFAALGVELFGKLECSDEHPCDGLGEHAHFKNFGMAFLTLFRIATGDNWNGIMKDALRDDCDPSDRCESNCCVDPILAPCFFIIFVLISQFVLVNVVVAVLMKHLEESNKREEASDGHGLAGTDTDANKTDTDVEDNANSSQKDLDNTGTDTKNEKDCLLVHARYMETPLPKNNRRHNGHSPMLR